MGLATSGAEASGRVRVVGPQTAGGWNRLAKSLSSLIRVYCLAEQRWDSPVTAELGRRSVASWLDEIKADADLRAVASGLRGFFLADPEELSLLAFVDQFASNDEPGVKLHRIDGGNDRLSAALAAALGDRVKLNTEVVAVSHRGREVRVSVKNGRNVAQLTRDYLVLALPATLLRRIPISPALPGATARSDRAIELRARDQDPRPVRPPVLARDGPTSCVRVLAALWRGVGRQRGAEGKPGILSLLAGGGASTSRSR